MRVFVIASQTTDMKFEFGIDESGLLRTFTITGQEYDQEKVMGMALNLAKDAKNVINMYKQKFPNLIRELRTEVPSFLDFWNTYDHKYDKKIAEDRWKKLSDRDKIAAFEYIGRYFYEIQKTGVFKKYAKTYLHEKPWRE